MINMREPGVLQKVLLRQFANGIPTTVKVTFNCFFHVGGSKFEFPY